MGLGCVDLVNAPCAQVSTAVSLIDVPHADLCQSGPSPHKELPCPHLTSQNQHLQTEARPPLALKRSSHVARLANYRQVAQLAMHHYCPCLCVGRLLGLAVLFLLWERRLLQAKMETLQTKNKHLFADSVKDKGAIRYEIF